MWLGTNDLADGGKSAAQTYALLTQYIADRHKVGWKVITATMLSRKNTDDAKNQYNAFILPNTAGADAIVNFTNTVLGCDGCSLDTTWFMPDAIHPNQAGVSTIEVPLFQAAINSLTH